MAGAARDFGILAFGLSLSLFGVLFCWWMIKTAYDEAERGPQYGARAAVGSGITRSLMALYSRRRVQAVSVLSIEEKWRARRSRTSSLLIRS